MLDHYWQLAWRYRRIAVWAVAGAALAGLLLGAVLLQFKPTYVAKTKVLLLPSDAEMEYARGLVPGELVPLTLTETHIEYLRSRPVAEMVLERLRNSRGDQVPAAGAERETPLPARLLAAVKALYHLLNYGMHVEADAEEALVGAIASSINVENVRGSYILLLEVRMKTPELAAAVANTLAEVYVERVTEDLEVNAVRVGAVLDRQIESKQAELESLLLEESRLRRELGLITSAEERVDLAASRTQERKALAEDRVDLQALEARLEELRQQRRKSLRPELLARIDEEISSGESSLRALSSAIAERQANLERLDAQLTRLEEKEEPLAALLAKRSLLQQDLARLQQRALEVDLSGSTAMRKIKVLEEAREPTYPESPQVFNYAVTGALAGLVVFALVLVAVDTFATTVTTSSQLDAACGGASLGRIGRRLLAEAADPMARGGERLRRRLELFGRQAEQRLSALGGLDADRLLITGFVRGRELAAATVALSAALAAQRRRVTCATPVAGELEPASGWLGVESLELVPPPAGGPAGGAGGAGEVLHVEQARSVLDGFACREAAERSAALVCAVPAERLSATQIEEFERRVEAAGLPSVAYVLLEA